MIVQLPKAWMHPNCYSFAITGGPGGGKSSLLAKAFQRLTLAGACVRIVPEVATELIRDAKFAPIEGWDSPRDFQRHVLTYQIQRELLYTQMLAEQQSGGPRVLLCDRSTRCAIPYLPAGEFDALCGEMGINPGALLSCHNAVIHLVSAADGAEEFYTLENNLARTETPARARELDRGALAAWSGHAKHFIVDNSTGFEEKVLRALNHIMRMLGMPEATEDEHSFHVINSRAELKALLPADTVTAHILQNYLVSSDPAVERRVRVWTVDDCSTYFYTEKRDGSVPGSRMEKERPIPYVEYAELIRERDPGRRAIDKLRHSFPYLGHRFEVDEMHFPARGLIKAEVEADLSTMIEFPPGWKVVNVTGNKRYSMASIAEGSFGW